jgi:Txe/YoeB family toxin of Txe-Axe toxin-antitoxin module
VINEIRRDPFTGTGEPEALKYNLTGFWSPRITGEHRLVHAVKNDELVKTESGVALVRVRFDPHADSLVGRWPGRNGQSGPDVRVGDAELMSR